VVIERKFFGATKTLVASAYAAHLTRRAKDFGCHKGRYESGQSEKRRGCWSLAPKR